jgi:hypothetical protein
MVIVGAKGFAKELLNIAIENKIANIALFDNVNEYSKYEYFGYEILKSEYQVKKYFERTNDNTFHIGVGGPANRFKLYNLFTSWGGKCITLISRNSDIGIIGTGIGIGTSICSGVVITSDISIGICCLLNLKVTISHDTVIGGFC